MTARIPPPIDQGDTTIAIAGDWHGNQPWAKNVIQQIAEAGVKTILHVGDFGLFRNPYSKRYLDAVEKQCAELGIRIVITDGNHEDHDWRLELEAVNFGNPALVRPHIWLLPRGYRWTHADRTFLSFGGAPSIDFMFRPAHSWWASEVVTEDDIRRAIDGGHVDVMIAHDAPAPATPKVDQIRASNPMGWPWKAQAYAAKGTDAMTRAYNGVLPDIFFHGHYHVNSAAIHDGRTIISLNQDGKWGNVVLLDLTDMTSRWLDAEADEVARRKLTWEADYTTSTPAEG